MTTKQKKQDKAEQIAATATDRSPSKAQDLVKYFEDSRVELGKVSWPTRKEVRVTSLAVLALVVVMAIFLGIADLILSRVMSSIIAIGS